MAPENDNTPKAPDKNEKIKIDNDRVAPTTAPQSRNIPAENKHVSVSKLNDGELKALLDEAINYKNPKDREGKSDLFNNLLLEAEENERNARAASAGGSELVRYCNPSAKRRSRHRRETNSISENPTHGGSLNNLAKEELYETTSHLTRPRKSVSARQREGGSLPCNVNAGVTVSCDMQFFEEVRRKKESQSTDMERKSLIEHDKLNEDFMEQSEIEMVQHHRLPIPVKYTTSATLQVGNVDDAVTMSALEQGDRTSEGANCQPLEHLHTRVLPNNHHGLIQSHHFWNPRSVEDKKVDENCNALGQGSSDNKKNKKKKIQTEKNVVVTEAEYVAGHRGDIIDDVDKLMEFIRGDKGSSSGAKSKNNVHKSKLHKHVHSGEEKGTKKQRARSKGKNTNLQKSSSLDEMSSTAKLEDFVSSENASSSESKVPLRTTKSNADRTRERRSWGNTEQIQYQLYTNVSAENLETAEFRVVTKKKKSKKRRNSISSSHRQQYSRDSTSSDFNRVPSPELRRNQACSVPHSEKSNDSSDVDSVHSLPIDTNVPISYADIAKNSNSLDRPKWNRPPSERKQALEKTQTKNNVEKSIAKATVSPDVEKPETGTEKPVKVKPQAVTQGVQTSPWLQHATHVEKSPISCNAVVHSNAQNLPPDVHNIENFPSIQSNKSANAVASKNGTNNGKVSNKNNSPNNNIKNMKNTHNSITNKNAVMNLGNINAVQQMQMNVSQNHEDYPCLQNIQGNLQPMPQNIPDVQTIEKMHFAQVYDNNNVPAANHVVQSPPQAQPSPPEPERHPSVDCDSVERTSSECGAEEPLPAVVILSGEQKEVSGLVFGFEVNEKLLSDDVCDTFMSRFIVPVKFNTRAYNHDKIVNFIGQAWEEVVVKQSSGKVQYYTEDS